MLQKWTCRASVMVQWSIIGLPMKGTWVQFLVQEDSPRHGATEPEGHNYWACVLQLLKPAHCNKTSDHDERSPRTATGEGPWVAPKTQQHRKFIHQWIIWKRNTTWASTKQGLPSALPRVPGNHPSSFCLYHACISQTSLCSTNS